MAPPRSMVFKICSREDCVLVGQEQILEKFYITKSGHPKGECKDCTNILQKKYYKNNQEQVKERQKLRDENRKEQISVEKKKYYQTHKLQKNNYSNEYNKKRRKEDPIFKLVLALRTRMNMAVRDNQKTGSAVADLMMSIPDFKKYLEIKFYCNPRTGEIMSWDNYGKLGWHIDHIIPLSKFNLADPEQFKKACHYTNLQPMWWFENLSKGNKV